MKVKLILWVCFLTPFLGLAQTSSRNLETVKKLIEEKKYSLAVDGLTELLVDNEETELYRLRAKANHQLKNYDAEIADYQKLLIFSDEGNTRLSLATAYLMKRDTAEATKTVELNIEKHPDHIASYAYLAGLASRRKNSKLALEILSDAYATFQSPLLLAIRAEEYRKQGKYEEALGDYETLVSKSEIPSLLFKAAQCASETGNYKKTMQYYKRYLDKEPNSSAALNNVANALSKVGNFSDAEIFLKKAVDISPRNLFALSGQAMLAYKKGEVDEAFSIIDASLLFQSKSKINSFIRGYLNAYEGNLTEAEADFTASLADAQQNKYVILALAQLYIYQTQYSKAVEFATQSINRTEVATPEAFNLRGFAYYKMGKIAEALQDFVTAKSLDADYQPKFNYAKADGKQVIENYNPIQFFLPLNDVNDCKTGFYTDGKDVFDFKVRVLSTENLDASKIKIFESGNVIDPKYVSIKSVEKRNFKLMGMAVTDVAIHYTPKSRKSYLKVSYNGNETQTLKLIK